MFTEHISCTWHCVDSEDAKMYEQWSERFPSTEERHIKFWYYVRSTGYGDKINAT